MKRDQIVESDAALARLFAEVQADPRAHDFFALVRRIESLCPREPRIGRALRPSQEALRLGQDAELDFAVAALSSFEAKGRAAPRLGVRFFGLFGPQGPMPLHFTEYVRERLRYRGDAAPARFLDVFHHRLLALFYRAWAEAQPVVQAERPHADRFAAWLGAGCGVDPCGAATSRLPAHARLYQAGLLGTRSRHPEGLAKLLASYFGVPVRIEEHVPQWLVLADEDRSRLGFARSRPERFATPAAQLGRTATGGSKQRDRQFKFRIALGPLTLAQYLGFLPGGTAWRALADWVVAYTGLDLRWDVRLVLAGAAIPEPRLRGGALPEPPWRRPVRLGVTAWLGRIDRRRDRGDLRLRPDASPSLHLGAVHA